MYGNRVLLCLSKRMPACPCQKPNAERHYLLGSVQCPKSHISTLKTIYVACSRPQAKEYNLPCFVERLCRNDFAILTRAGGRSKFRSYLIPNSSKYYSHARSMIVSEELFATHLKARETDLRIAGTPGTVSGRAHGAC